MTKAEKFCKKFCDAIDAQFVGDIDFYLFKSIADGDMEGDVSEEWWESMESLRKALESALP